MICRCGGGAAGERVPMPLVGREPAEAYAWDRRARAEEALLPFRRLYCCGLANVTVSASCAQQNTLTDSSHFKRSAACVLV
jgi:hypothetical protein